MYPLHFIVADVQPIYCLGMETAIRKYDSSYRVFHATSGFEILEIVKKSTIHLIFMDILMPEINGLKTLRNIREINPSIKIIGLTKKSKDNDVLNFFKAGADGYLFKNLSLEKMEKAIHSIVRGNNCFTEEIRCFFSGKLNQKCKTKLDNVLREELSEREKEILRLICKQHSTNEISDLTGLSKKTIELHRGHIMAKTHSKNMVGLALYAIEKKLFCLEHFND
jgi:DNA-binding NarL/FixJ family response regulator